MPDAHSKQSRALANVRLQLRTGNTRGKNPRKLDADEIHILEKKAAQLQEEMAEAQHQRTVARTNSHTTREAESTRAAVHNEGQLTRQAFQPIAALVTGEDGDVDDRIRVKRNQIALLRAGVREDLAAKKREREQARAGASSHTQGAGTRRKQPRLAVDQTTLLHKGEPVEEGQPEEESMSEPTESEAEEQVEELQDATQDGLEDASEVLQVAMRPPNGEVLPSAEAVKDNEDTTRELLCFSVRVVVIALGGEPQHVLLRTTEACSMARYTVAVKADAILGCQLVAEFKGDVQDLGNDFARLLPCVWQDITRHLKYGRPKPTEDMVKLWSELQNLVMTAIENERTGPVGKVKLAGTSCRCDKLYDIKVAPGAVTHMIN